jgi:hypothetical protein
MFNKKTRVKNEWHRVRLTTDIVVVVAPPFFVPSNQFFSSILVSASLPYKMKQASFD